ncbi:CTLH/CRA C-terminal to lish motif domain-containing protein [Copromyces sp. CBS 386.78]|nr:CTLH/CRA C-terminal to lish motif domain-containing protein [Copromyces sp. CBS 386.78]
MDPHRRIQSQTSSTSTATPSKHAFETKVADVKSPKSDINALILDYLMMEGYPKAAEKFQKEANLKPRQEDPTINARQEIQHAIHVGNIQKAISDLNELDPGILDSDPHLHFSLLRLQLIELIRNARGYDPTAAINFAQEKLAPRAASNEQFLKELEKTMALLIFPPDKLQPDLAALLHSDLRRNTADQVNEAVLHRHMDRREAAIRQLVRMRAWAESSSRSKKRNLPDRIELGLNNGDDNVHEPMILS